MKEIFNKAVDDTYREVLHNENLACVWRDVCVTFLSQHKLSLAVAQSHSHSTNTTFTFKYVGKAAASVLCLTYILSI